MKSILSAVIIALTVCSSQAGLGWTLAECKQHYGKLLRTRNESHGPNKERGIEYYFAHDGYVIQVSFLDGRASRISYQTGGALLQSQIDDTLAANAPEGETWSGPKKDDVSGTLTWLVNDPADPHRPFFIARLFKDGSLNVWNRADNDYMTHLHEDRSKNL
jgi:hypothetical protein